VLVSSGTLLAVVGMAGLGGGGPLVAAALFYLVASTIALSALYLLAELIEQDQGAVAAMLTVTAEAYGLGDEEFDEAEAGAGPGVPGATSVLALSFVACALVIAGMPPLAGFIGKFAMLAAALGSGTLAAGGIASSAVAFTALVIVSGLAAIIALARVGIRAFWASEEEPLSVPLVEIVPVVLLLALVVAMTVKAGPVMRYMEATASALEHPHVYIRGVLGTAPPEPGGDR
jgi:multicomponent K+:H+ antiporter subunit D